MSAAAVVADDSTTAPSPLSDEQARLNLESFDYVWTTIRDKHWDPKPGGLDWEAVRGEFRPRVETAETMAEARAAMGEMIEGLDQSHFGIIPAEVYEELSLPEGNGTTGIDARVVEGQALVTSVADESPAAVAGVKPGWIIVRIGDDELLPRLEKVAEEFAESGYKDLALAGVVKGRLGGKVGDETTVSFVDGEGSEVQRSLTLVSQPGEKVQIGFLPPFHIWIDHEMIDGDIGYIAFNMFIDPATLMPAFNGAMKEFMDAEGIVIDLRGNPGGLIGMAMGMAGWLVAEKNRHLGTMYTRETELKIVVFPRPSTYGGPVAILVDGLSGSCSEVFAGGLQDLNRARVFGSRTMGAVLPSAIEKLPNGDGFQFAFANYVSEGGEVLEGTGVVPNTEVVPTRKALLQGRDPVLEAAIAWIRAQE
jgi:carboxyl-terminal processing protease